jgi:hypothetical protein
VTSDLHPRHQLPAQPVPSDPTQPPAGWMPADRQPFGYPPVQGPAPQSVPKSAASLVCGLLGMIFAILPIAWFFGWILCIIGIALGTRKRSTAGLVMGIIGLAITVAQFVYVGTALSSLG